MALRASAGGPPVLTPDVKQQVADEVRAQLALENQEAGQNAQSQDVDPGSSGIARLVSDVQNGHPHVFVAGGSVDVVDANSGAECAISDGDAVQLRLRRPRTRRRRMWWFWPARAARNARGRAP